MNCKPGDLAMFVRVYDAEDAQFLGVTIKVTRTIRNRLGNACWCYEGEKHKDADGIPVIAFEDLSLIPLRDSDSADEALTLAGSPQEVKV